MRSVIVIAFYIWLAISVAMLFARLAKRFSARAGTTTGDETPSATGSTAASSSSAPTIESPATRATEPAEGSGPASTSPETLPGGGPMVTGPGAVGASTERVAPPPDKTLAELLAGIDVPNDLVPIVPEGGGNDRSTASLITDAPAAEVGKGVADELERLGYELKVLGSTEILARRGDDFLSVSLVLDPESPDEGGRRRFPTAKEGDVVVDFWVGAGPRPGR